MKSFVVFTRLHPLWLSTLPMLLLIGDLNVVNSIRDKRTISVLLLLRNGWKNGGSAVATLHTLLRRKHRECEDYNDVPLDFYTHTRDLKKRFTTDQMFNQPDV
mmetsp:Transcript_32667/g.75175  ORF Transcript_32667/g.75175 Transcript_32667/m.75175 type:complete len:103 (+) Transcript_32667:169-477(+)